MSRPIKRSIDINGNKTSVSLENDFWSGLHEIARQKNITTTALIAMIASVRNKNNLSSAIRLFVLNHFRMSSGPADNRTASKAPE
jgi:predicted DNA-binding ribbon-helix-helix protein